MINIVVLSIPIYFLLIGIELLIQRFQKRQIYRLNDAVTNISCGITQQLTGVFFKVLSIGAYYLVYEYLRLFTIPGNWLTWIILFFAADFCYYWAHRMSHEINLFWGGHVVHHQSEDYNFSVALRQSSFQVIWTFAFYLPLALIGFGPEEFVIVSALVTVYQFWIHTETIGKLGVLEKFLNTPSHHRVHHGRDPKYIDRNHAGVFIIWDKLFGTFVEEQEKPTYGITKPVNSWNPVWVNLEHYDFMWQELRQIKGFKNKLKYIFYKPGWLPEELGGYRQAPDIPKSYKKYNLAPAGPVTYYALFQYLIALAGTAFFLFNLDIFALLEKVAITSAIILTIVNIGALFEQRFWVNIVELLRVGFVSLGLFFLANTGGNFLLIITSMCYFVLSIGWMTYIVQSAKTIKAS